MSKVGELIKEALMEAILEQSNESLEHKDSKGNVLQHGDILHNPNNGQIAVYDRSKPKSPKFHLSNGAVVNAHSERRMISKHWTRIAKDDVKKIHDYQEKVSRLPDLSNSR